MKKPGEFKASRRRHLEAQARSDALKKLKLGEPTTVWALTEAGARHFEVRPLIGDEPIDGQTVLCVYGHKLRVMLFIEKDGLKVIDSNRCGHIRLKRVFGIVTGELSNSEN